MLTISNIIREARGVFEGAAQAWLRGRVGRPYGEHHRPHLGGGEQQPDVHQLRGGREGIRHAREGRRAARNELHDAEGGGAMNDYEKIASEIGKVKSAETTP